MKNLFLTAAEGTVSSVSVWMTALSKLNLSTILAAVVIFAVGYVLIKWAAKLLDKLLARNEKLIPASAASQSTYAASCCCFC